MSDTQRFAMPRDRNLPWYLRRLETTRDRSDRFQRRDRPGWAYNQRRNWRFHNGTRNLLHNLRQKVEQVRCQEELDCAGLR